MAKKKKERKKEKKSELKKVSGVSTPEGLTEDGAGKFTLERRAKTELGCTSSEETRKKLSQT
jgi:hypothetical protein